MAVDIPKQPWSGRVREVTLGATKQEGGNHKVIGITFSTTGEGSQCSRDSIPRYGVDYFDPRGAVSRRPGPPLATGGQQAPGGSELALFFGR